MTVELIFEKLYQAQLDEVQGTLACERCENSVAVSHVLQCVAVCCSGLQYVAVCCSVLQCVAVWINTYAVYRVAKTHRMPEVASHFSAKEPLIMRLFCGK